MLCHRSMGVRKSANVRVSSHIHTCWSARALQNKQLLVLFSLWVKSGVNVFLPTDFCLEVSRAGVRDTLSSVLSISVKSLPNFLLADIISCHLFFLALSWNGSSSTRWAQVVESVTQIHPLTPASALSPSRQGPDALSQCRQPWAAHLKLSFVRSDLGLSCEGGDDTTAWECLLFVFFIFFPAPLLSPSKSGAGKGKLTRSLAVCEESSARPGGENLQDQVYPCYYRYLHEGDPAVCAWVVIRHWTVRWGRKKT